MSFFRGKWICLWTLAALLPVSSAVYASALDAEAEIPSYYNLAEMGKKPVVRSQGNTGTCWALSSVSALESDLLPESDLKFSADHMSLNNGFTLTQEDGGDYYMIMSYLADWKGPVLEEEDPYGDGVSPDGLSAAVHVQEIRLLKEMDHDEIKQMILTYGAAQSSLCLNRARTDTDEFHFYNAEESAYFDPMLENVDHDILILGWDDDYPKENFRIQPPNDGAWICQNTWGESFGEDGIFYVSYQDRNLFRKGGLVYGRIEGIDNYSHVYENDTLGWQGRQGYSDDQCWFAGAYTALSEENLSAVGIYSTGPGTTCRIYVIPNFTGPEDLCKLAELSEGQQETEPIDGEKTAEPPLASSDETENDQAEMNMPQAASGVIYAAETHMDTAGYFTIDLEEAIPLTAGQQFAVAVWIETEGQSKPVAVEMVKDQYTQNVTFDGRQTWISSDAQEWERTQEAYETNVCLKAYTRSTNGDG